MYIYISRAFTCTLQSQKAVFINLMNLQPELHNQSMAILFNKLLEQGLSPACWGIARIKLIYKVGDTSDPTNFRPIALTSVVSKVFHKIICGKLY